MDKLIEKLKSHIGWEEGMDETMLSSYIEQGQRYIKKSCGREVEYLVIICAGIFYEYRVAEKELKEALDAMTPLIIQEQYDGEEIDE